MNKNFTISEWNLEKLRIIYVNLILKYTERDYNDYIRSIIEIAFDNNINLTYLVIEYIKYHDKKGVKFNPDNVIGKVELKLPTRTGKKVEVEKNNMSRKKVIEKNFSKIRDKYFYNLYLYLYDLFNGNLDSVRKVLEDINNMYENGIILYKLIYNELNSILISKGYDQIELKVDDNYIEYSRLLDILYDYAKYKKEWQKNKSAPILNEEK